MQGRTRLLMKHLKACGHPGLYSVCESEQIQAGVQPQLILLDGGKWNNAKHCCEHCGDSELCLYNYFVTTDLWSIFFVCSSSCTMTLHVVVCADEPTTSIGDKNSLIFHVLHIHNTVHMDACFFSVNKCLSTAFFSFFSHVRAPVFAPGCGVYMCYGLFASAFPWHSINLRHGELPWTCRSLTLTQYFCVIPPTASFVSIIGQTRLQLTKAQYVSGGSPHVILGGSRVTRRYFVMSVASGWQAM